MTHPCPKCGSEDCKCVISPHLYKNKINVMVLAILVGLIGFAGTGQMYLGKVKRGMGFAVGTLTCVFASIILGMQMDLLVYDVAGIKYGVFYVSAGIIITWVGLFIWSVYDAKKLCDKYNDHLEAEGVPPW